MRQDDPWIDELERDLGRAARERLIAAIGGQRYDVPRPANALRTKLAFKVGPEVAAWLADRFGGEKVEVPSGRGREAEDQGALLRAAILDAGLDAPTRSANELANEFRVSSTWIRRVRSQLRAERARALPLFRNQ